jgi:Fe-S-cluster containining protein
VTLEQFVPQEVCLKCQGCCRFKEEHSAWLPCLLDEEIQNLIDRPGIPAAALAMDKKIAPVKNPGGEGYLCAFFSPSDNKCHIYGFRPFECQLYPFLINLRHGKILLSVDLNCPYVAEHINSEKFKQYIDRLAAFLNAPDQLKLLKENPQVLQAYEEVSEIIELDGQA